MSWAHVLAGAACCWLGFTACATAPEENPPAGASEVAVQAAREQASLALADLDTERWRVAEGSEGLFVVAWRSLTGSVPRNAEFSIEVLVFEDGRRAANVDLTISSLMPAHHHGFVRAPIVVDLGRGHFQFDGVLFHMRGRWQLSFYVMRGDVRDGALFEFQL